MRALPAPAAPPHAHALWQRVREVGATHTQRRSAVSFRFGTPSHTYMATDAARWLDLVTCRDVITTWAARNGSIDPLTGQPLALSELKPDTELAARIK